MRRDNRRKAGTSSPKLIARKKIKHNYYGSDDSGDDNVFETQVTDIGRKGGRIGQMKRKRSVVTSSSESLEDEDDASLGSNFQCKSLPVPVDAGSAESDDSELEEVMQVEKRVRPRKRLSVRSSESASDRPPESTAASEAGHHLVAETRDDVQNIYETYCQMFDSNKIKPQNAFDLKLLDCINEMIDSPGYDKCNMQLASGTLEIGTKIFTCRVDNTHLQVLSLASDLTLQQRKGKKNGAMEDGAPGSSVAADLDDSMKTGKDTTTQQQQQRQRKTVKKRGRFVEEDNSRLLSEFEQTSAKFVTRRNFLKKKFDNDVEFDYLGFTMDQDADVENPLSSQSEENNMQNFLSVPDSLINRSDMCRLDYLPYVSQPSFDPEVSDIWGLPLEGTSSSMQCTFSTFQASPNDDFYYDPTLRPTEYPDSDEGAASRHLMNDTLRDATFRFDDGNDHDENDDSVSAHDIPSLDLLDKYFQRAKNNLNDKSCKYGWAGPNFSSRQINLPVNKKGVKKQRTKKQPKLCDFTKIDWDDKANQFNITNPFKTVYDDKIIESWGSKKHIIPFLGFEGTSYDDIHPTDFLGENDKNYIPNVFRLFTSPNHSILYLGKVRKRKMQPTTEIPDQADLDSDYNDVDTLGASGADLNIRSASGEHHIPDDPTSEYARSQISETAMTQSGVQNSVHLPSLVSGTQDPMRPKPKPINMRNLKQTILQTLITELHLDAEGQPVLERETKLNLSDLMMKVLKELDERTEKILSVSLFIVALMHVVAEKRLLVLDETTDPNCPVVICKGKSFNIEEHLSTMNINGLDFE